MGEVVAIFIARGAAAGMEAVNEATLESGRGIAGDRYHSGIGTFSSKGRHKPDSEVTLIESEEIDRFNRVTGQSLDYGAPRRNVVTRGIALNELLGVRFKAGEVVLEGIRLCEPCAHLARLAGSQVLPELVHRAGLRATIISGGRIRPKDIISAAL
jgi:MOSC domain-containing protein YiiM